MSLFEEKRRLEKQFYKNKKKPVIKNRWERRIDEGRARNLLEMEENKKRKKKLEDDRLAHARALELGTQKSKAGFETVERQEIGATKRARLTETGALGRLRLTEKGLGERLDVKAGLQKKGAAFERFKALQGMAAPGEYEEVGPDVQQRRFKGLSEGWQTFAGSRPGGIEVSDDIYKEVQGRKTGISKAFPTDQSATVGRGGKQYTVSFPERQRAVWTERGVKVPATPLTAESLPAVTKKVETILPETFKDPDKKAMAVQRFQEILQNLKKQRGSFILSEDELQSQASNIFKEEFRQLSKPMTGQQRLFGK